MTGTWSKTCLGIKEGMLGFSPVSKKLGRNLPIASKSNEVGVGFSVSKLNSQADTGTSAGASGITGAGASKKLVIGSGSPISCPS